ncbi:MAG TPA: PASTA domain-containing protein, partial [Chitinophagaceae bacterium]|nr:PASTA domain-containing protein [Chitinophagaceae bacterium]
MFKFITHKSFFVNLLVIILIVVILAVLFFSLLGVITKHNENAKVPSVTGMSYDEAKKLLEQQGFTVKLQDSIYVDTAAKLQVLRQNPDADDMVKEGRTIFLTINRAVPPLVEMPDLRGFSLKSAEMYLQNIGLKLGDTSFVPDIARNAVKEQNFNGKALMPGTKLPMGSAIDLVIGSGIGEEQMAVPDLIGLTVAQSRQLLSLSSIEIGAVIADGAVSDTENAFVIRQSPEPYARIADSTTIINHISTGQVMDIWISASPPVKDSLQTP